MQTSQAGLNLIKRCEGFRSHAYKDVNGNWTIGYGHRLKGTEWFPEGVNQTFATKLLADDVQTAEQAVERLVKVALTQGQFDALVDFCYNLGAGRLASSTLLKVLNDGRYADAAQQLLQWDVAAGTENAGLKARREAEIALWNEEAPVLPAAVKTA